jgi:hypothetical protein
MPKARHPFWWARSALRPLVVFADRPAGLLSHADGSGLFPEARPKLTALCWEEIRLALMLDIGSN